MSFLTFQKWKEQSPETCAYKMDITEAGHRKDVKILAFCKIILSKYETRKYFFL